MATSRTIARVLWATLAFGPPALHGDSVEVCALTFRVIDILGAPIPFNVSGLTDHRGVDYSSRFVGPTAKVPCGAYSYVLSRTDLVDSPYSRLTGRVDAFDVEGWLTLVTNPNLVVIDSQVVGVVSSALPPGFVFKGRVLNANPTGRLWVRLQAAFKPDNVEVQADPDGEFRLYRLIRGQCLLYVMNDTRVEYVESVTVLNGASKESLVIDLAQPPPKDRVIR